MLATARRLRPVHRAGLVALYLLASTAFTAPNLANDRPLDDPRSAAGSPKSFRGTLIVSEVERGAAAEPSVVPHSFESWYPGRSRLVCLVGDGEGVRRSALLSEGLVAARDPDVSFAGDEVLFAGKAAEEDDWQLWTVGLDGSAPERLVDVPQDCFGPRWLPSGQITYFSPSGSFEEDGPRRAMALFVIDAVAGDPPLRITFNPSSDFRPLVLPDGRILHATWRHNGTYHGRHGVFGLATVQWDGCGPWGFDDDHSPEGIRLPTFVTTQGDVLAVRYPSLASSDGLEVISFTGGDPYAGERVVAPSSSGTYRSAVGAPEGLVVALRPSSGESYGVWFLSEEGKPASLLYDDPSFDATDLALAMPRPMPLDRFASYDEQEETGLLFCQDVYRSSLFRLPRGKVERVRIIEGIPLESKKDGDTPFLPAGTPLDLPGATSNSTSGFLQKRIVGEVEPQADGSFFARVPADRPLHIQLVDARGVAVATQASWFWVRPGERRGCIGCHEDRETSVRNHAPLATELEPEDLSTARTMRAVDFRRDIVPILTRRCAVESCHAGPEPTGDLDMRLEGSLVQHEFAAPKQAASVRRDGYFDRVYESFLRPVEGKPHEIGGALVHPGFARNSPLVWMVFGRRLGPRYRPAPFRRPIRTRHPGDEVTADELRRIAEWVDLGAPWDNLPGPDRWSPSLSGGRSGSDTASLAAREGISRSQQP